MNLIYYGIIEIKYLISSHPQEMPYPMSQPYLGYAVVINNSSSDVQHWVLDAVCIKSALDTVGFQVKAYNDCNVQVSIGIS